MWPNLYVSWQLNTAFASISIDKSKHNFLHQTKLKNYHDKNKAYQSPYALKKLPAQLHGPQKIAIILIQTKRCQANIGLCRHRHKLCGTARIVC